MAKSNIPDAAQSINEDDPDANLGLLDFCDPRVFASSNAYFVRKVQYPPMPDQFDVSQGNQHPTFIVVGTDVSDERIIRNLPELGQRYGVTLGQLQAARRDELVRVR